MRRARWRVGLISDTHGLLRPQALAFLEGCHHIVHAGDIGTPQVLEALARLAPLTAVRGNNDQGAWAERLPLEARCSIGAVTIQVLHELSALEPEAAARVVVSGHSHRPVIARRDGRLYINPGSAGPRRFRLPIALAELVIDGARLRPRIVELDPEA